VCPCPALRLWPYALGRGWVVVCVRISVYCVGPLCARVVRALLARCVGTGLWVVARWCGPWVPAMGGPVS